MGGVPVKMIDEGEAEPELPVACGGGYEQRSRSGDVCRDGCFVDVGDGFLAVAGSFREGNLLALLKQTGRRFRTQGILMLGEEEVTLLDEAAAERVRASFLRVHGVMAAEVPAREGRPLVHILAWHREGKGWEGILRVVVAAQGSLKAIEVARVKSPGSPREKVSEAPPEKAKE